MKKHGFFSNKTIPAIIMMCLIFGFSAQDSQASGQLSSHVTVRLVSACESLLDRGWSAGQIAQYALFLEHYIRKAAHMTEYFLLAAALSLPLLYVYRPGIRHLAPAVWLFCILFACMDEFHQLFVPGRAASLGDVCFDAAGSLIGVCVSRLPGRRSKGRRSKDRRSLATLFSRSGIHKAPGSHFP